MPHKSPDSLGPNINVSIKKQERILDIVDRWKVYRIDPFKGEVWRHYPMSIGKKSKWRKVKHHVNGPANRPRYHLYYKAGKEDDTCGYETINALHLMWLIAYGHFDARLKLKPIDGNWFNYKISNITVDLPIRKELVNDNHKNEFTALVRFQEIRTIRGMMNANPTITAAEISKSLQLNYSSVYRAMSKIRKGQKLRFEEPGPYNQKKNTFDNMIPGDYLD